ncbi:MAG: 2-polyprenyl-3-methyl-6-methoxy-1,4-benzoquinone monooxygenase [Gammaproteobacteria bacterium]|nr:2-polyprenyl-3-methyl-6-methoxy-1,4-benzoquinone monooxygenase [Gammaproteobacteria bacterium]MDH3767716.1 2-polyprenyl-3-methyl-6-methoxy-1,4-benzoquinone monooxygenase [Gammaproteobacteria bacterium]
MSVRHNGVQTGRRHTVADQFVAAADQALRSLIGTPTAARSNPASQQDDVVLRATERRHAARLMRVNHSGEVAAQALYQGQALTARLDNVRDSMEQSAAEESDHLAWCEQRLSELGGHRSLLNPLWYAGSFAIGAIAGIAGDRWSLGFVAETERQVVRHLDGHLNRLPERDERSRAILTQMRSDEAEHGEKASRAGGQELPRPVPELMTAVSSIMTRAAYWI